MLNFSHSRTGGLPKSLEQELFPAEPSLGAKLLQVRQRRLHGRGHLLMPFKGLEGCPREAFRAIFYFSPRKLSSEPILGRGCDEALFSEKRGFQ